MTDYLVRASALNGIRPTVDKLGGDTDALLGKTGLTNAEGDPDSWISYRSFLLLLDEAARATDCPHFGLRLSEQQDIGILGAVGFVMQQAPDLRTALRELATHFAHHNQGATISLKVEEGVAQWCFSCKLEGYAPMRQQGDLVAGLGIDLMRLLWNPRWSPNALYLPHGAPQDVRPYKTRFDCPIFFNWDTMIMTFDPDILDSPVRSANPHLHQVLEEHLSNLQRDYGDDYPGQIRHLIKQALTTGDCSIEKIAGFLAVNKRTLQRQLQAHNTSYKSQLEDVRFEIARRYLRESNGSLSALADMLCYSELSVFSNAFRQRYGVSPRAWRKTQLES